MIPSPRVFSEAFRRYLCEHDRVLAVHRWERQSRRGYWKAWQQIVAVSAGLGILFYLLTQGRTVESLLTLVTSTGAIFFPKLRDLFAKLPKAPASGGEKAQARSRI